MNKWWLLLLALSGWMAIGFAVFGPSGDHQNEAAPLPDRVERIVSMAPSLTEILFALGLDEEIVGVTLYSDYPPAATEKPKMGSFWQPNIEAVMAARPGLVVTLGFGRHNILAERLKRIGHNSLPVNIEKVDDLFEAIDTIGKATGRPRRADELTNSIRKKLNGLSILAGNEAKIRVLWVVQREPLRVAGRDTFVNEMIELAGGENAIGRTVHPYPPIGAEQVIACGAEVIIEPAMGQEGLAEQRDSAFRYWSRFKSLPAVTNERIYVIRGDTVSRLGPRLHEGTETIARCLRPHLFEN